MASNSFGTLFRITTWGESHGKAIGVVIDGCPAGLPLTEEEINRELAKRRPGGSLYTSPRKEEDTVEILSGLFEGKTTGTPLSLLIWNKDADTSKYTSTKELLKPGHANFTYLEKYGLFDYRGGGRASARETACRVAAGAVAKKLLDHAGIQLVAYLREMGGLRCNSLNDCKEITAPLFCPDPHTCEQMVALLETAQKEGDSLGGVVELLATSLPVGLGDPIYEKLEANLAKAMLSLPASKGFEIGSGFEAARMKGSLHNDPFTLDEKGEISTETNHAGGTLGGISSGMPLRFRVAFKPTSSIKKPQKTLSLQKEEASFELPEGSRHDPCVAIRAVPVVEAMTALVLADALLLHRSSRLQ